MTIKSWADVDRLTNDLEDICNWRDELRIKVRRARLRFELIGLDPEKQEELECEFREFQRVCRGLSFWTERRAA